MVNIVRPIYSRYTKVYTKVYIFNFVSNGLATDILLEQYRGLFTTRKLIKLAMLKKCGIIIMYIENFINKNV